MSETTTTPAAKLTLEKTTCGRCGGSGKYSYCQTMRGPFGPYTCFKCGGAGRLLTKRGVKAAAFIKRVFSKPAADLIPGDVVRMDGDNKFRAVKTAEWETEDNWSCRAGTKESGYTYYFRVITDHCNHGILDDQQLIRVGQSAERKAEVFPLVAEYQDLLTKAGKEPKAKAKAERVAEIKAALNIPADWDA